MFTEKFVYLARKIDGGSVCKIRMGLEKQREAGDGNRGLIYIARVVIAAGCDNYGHYHGRFERDKGVTLPLV